MLVNVSMITHIFFTALLIKVTRNTANLLHWW